MFSYIVLITFPTLCFSAAMVSQVTTHLERSLLFSSDQIFDQTYDVIGSTLDQVNAISDAIILNAAIANTISKDPASYPVYDQLGDMYELSAYLQAFNRGKEVTNIALYVNSDYLYASEKIRFLNINDALQSEWYNQMYTHGLNALWCPSEFLEPQSGIKGDSLAFIRTVQDPNNFAQTVGFLRVDFDQQDLLDTLQRSKPTERSVSLLRDSYGNIVLSSNTETVEQYGTQVFDGFQSSVAADWQTVSFGQNGVLCYVKSRPLSTSGWNFITIIPVDDIRISVKETYTFLFILLAVLSGISFVLAQSISKSMTKRLTLLASHMNIEQGGTLQLLPESEVHDEVGHVIHVYNYMVRQQQALMEEKYHLGEAAKMAELRALQSQINPHFLYNTLDLIKWMAVKGDISEVEITIKALADFYKCTLNKGRDVVTIEDELHHASLYHQIQNLRFKQKILLTTDVPEQVLHCPIPKITLQPLVENAILHGILGKDSKSGQVAISACQSGDEIILCVQDDGIGMRPEEILAMFSSEGDGYGVKNISERLRMFYGNAFRLTCRSKYGVGTCMELHIPAVHIPEKTDSEREQRCLSCHSN